MARPSSAATVKDAPRLIRLPAREQAAVLADLVRQRLRRYGPDEQRELVSELLMHVYRIEDRIINAGLELR